MDDTAYHSLAEANDDARWAFGTGFDDPLHGVDSTIADSVDRAELAALCLALGDDALIMAQRLSQWITNAPELEDEVALANIALDLLGQARLLLSRSAQAAEMPSRTDGRWPAEDELAYLREPREYRNVRLVELPRGDFACEIGKLLVFSTWRLALLGALVTSPDPVLAAIAAKGVKEVSYHRDYAAQWTVRLGDGTAFSHERMAEGLDTVWPYAVELFRENPELRDEFDDVIAQVCSAAGLTVPHVPADPRSGRRGEHTDALLELLEQMQGIARANLDATW